MNLKCYRQQYDEIKKLHKNKRTYRLSELMTKMEHDFHIPLLNDEGWNKEHKDIIKLYREISCSRVFEM